MDKFMKRAVELATENVRNGGEPFGAVLVKDGEQAAEGVNELHQQYDVTAHAEIQVHVPLEDGQKDPMQVWKKQS